MNGIMDNKKIKCIDNKGNETNLIEWKEGKYTTEDTAFHGTIGLFYKISIKTASGKSYESEFEELKQPVEIESIQYDAVNKGWLTGLQLYVNSHDPNNISHYYAWDYTETWQFEVPNQKSNPKVLPMKTCYRWNTPDVFIIKSTKDYAEDRLVKFPFYFIDNTSNRLYIKYSILLRQYVLNEKTFMFYRHLKDINENVGFLYDKIPVSLVGNMRNTVDPDEPVPGNFQVSGVSEKRLFIYNSDLPASVRFTFPSGFEYCRIKKIDLQTIKERNTADSLIGSGWSVLDTLHYTLPDGMQYESYLMVNSSGCYDCRLSGDIKMPSFWKDE
jgi:hypothetical protein